MRDENAGGARRILFVHPFADEGGAENVLVRLLARLDRSFEPVVLLMREGPLADALRELSIETHVHHLPGKKSVARFPFVAGEIARDVEGERIDLIHANGTKAALLAPLLARHLGRPPLVWMKHGHDFDWLAPRLIGPPYDRIVCVSEAVARSFPRRLRDRVSVCYPGVIPPPDPAPIESTEPLLVFAGRIDPKKGVSRLVRSIGVLRDRGIPGKLAIAGPVNPKSPRHGEELKELVGRLGLSGRVDFKGWVDDIDQLYDRARVVAMASNLWYRKGRAEGAGLVLLEGMSHARPVVAPNEGGMAEIVADAGTLVDAPEPEQFADALQPYFEDVELAREVGDRGRRRVHAGFTVEVMTQKLSVVYEELLP